MSQTSKENTPSSPAASNNSPPVGQTVQMNPAILGQAANMNPDTDLFKQLDTASEMLEQAADDDAQSDPSDSLPTIEQYMAALLQRSQNHGEEPSPSDADRVRDTPAKSETSNAVSEPVAKEPWQHVSAPECRNTISELRELANVSARSSFNVYRGQQLVYQMQNKLTVTLVALVVSFALITLTHSVRSPAFFAAIAALTVAMSWAVKYFHLGHQLQNLCFPSDDAEA